MKGALWLPLFMRWNSMKAAETYCLQLLRSRAYELYFAVLFAPPAKRGALAALYAFHLEILHIGEQVQEPLLGEMRLQWWRDSLIEALKKDTQHIAEKEQNSVKTLPVMAPQNPVIAAVTAAINRYNLPPADFLCLCEAARFDLYHDIMPSRAALETYCTALYGTVLQLACRILQGETGDLADKTCRHGGIAQGLAALIRHLPRTQRQGKIYIPADILASVGADEQSLRNSVVRQDPAENPTKRHKIIIEKRKIAIAAIFAWFHEHYKAFIPAQKLLPAGFRPAFLPLAVLPASIKQAEKQQEAVFTTPIIISPLCKQAKISRAAFFNRF
ncbi:phytoene/squalene synthase family protein [Candidatus Tokpelaia sp.]|nr:phytoene/squalene synthase family protein [Candidatus Tokpelaia sp.]